MQLLAPINRFLTDETGAVTVDWVVLTAATVGLGYAVIGAVEQGLVDLATAISEELAGIEVQVYPDETP